jgi:nucleoside 2-deoxyribosyltransferase
MTTVYLAGKIKGLTWHQMCRWRELAKTSLLEAGFQVLDPTDTCFDEENSSPYEIVASNKFMIDHSDIVLAELDHSHPHVSLGTIGEIVYANTKGVPVIAWGTASEVISTPWVSAHITKTFRGLAPALTYLIEKYNTSGVVLKQKPFSNFKKIGCLAK